MAKPVTVNDAIEGQVALDLECLDRVYLNAYVPGLQVGGQVVIFLTRFWVPRSRLRRSQVRQAEVDTSGGGSSLCTGRDQTIPREIVKIVDEDLLDGC